MPDKLKIRQAEAKDYPFMREMLYESIFIPEGEDRPPFSIIDDPAIYKYINGWMKASDIGFIAELGGEAVGAAWARLFENAEAGGYGFVDNSTPELGLAVSKEYRSKGIGTALMKALMAELKQKGYERISLSVDKLNRAVDFYKKLGFKVIKEKDTDYLMIKYL